MLIDQPTAAPSRKMTAVATSGAIATVVVTALTGILASRMPGLGEACAGEISTALVAGAAAALASATSFVSGYLRRERG